MQSGSATNEVALQIKAEKQASDRLPYMLQLDGLRALAVFGVLFGHFCMHGRREILPIAHWSVQLFFVLSGFLITGILLRCRDLSSRPRSRLDQLRQFYIRRTLRIFPVFYLIVLIAATINIPPVRETILWLVTYTTNIHLALRGGWHGSIDHFWSLAVEEQFYLLWPWLILFVADRYLLPCILAAIVLAPVYKLGGVYAGLNDVAGEVITFANFDSLGMGALLALYRYKKPSQFTRLGRHRIYGWISVALAMLGAYLFIFLQSAFSGIVDDLLLAIVFACIIHKASVGFGGPVGFLLETRPLLHCGKISYGIYLYHNFVPPCAWAFCKHFHLRYPQHPVGRLALFGGVTIAVATLSWAAFEQPVNNLKRRFRYSRR
jgi:peptidoglycan/LPS O-acetylase OafA/YrhL